MKECKLFLLICMPHTGYNEGLNLFAIWPYFHFYYYKKVTKYNGKSISKYFPFLLHSFHTFQKDVIEPISEILQKILNQEYDWQCSKNYVNVRNPIKRKKEKNQFFWKWNKRKYSHYYMDVKMIWHPLDYLQLVLQ